MGADIENSRPQEEFAESKLQNSKTRVLHILDAMVAGGGFDLAVEFVVRANLEPGQEHHLLALETSHRESVDVPSDVVVFEKGNRSTSELARWILSQNYDILHWHWWHGELDGFNDLMNEMARYGGHKRVLTCDVYPATPKFTLTQREMDYADMIVFDGKDAMLAYPQIPDHRKTFVVGGTDLSLYSLPRTRKEDGKFRMGRGSALAPLKCPPNLIELVAPILKAVPNAEFHIFGEGRREFVRRFRADMERLNLEDRVVLRGWVRNFREEVANLDLYLYHLPPNSYASSEMNLQGAMTAGLPIVVMLSNGTRWMFQHEVNAMVAETPFQAQEYSIYLANHPQERAKLGRSARETAMKDFGMDNMVQGYLKQAYPNCTMHFGKDYIQKRSLIPYLPRFDASRVYRNLRHLFIPTLSRSLRLARNTLADLQRFRYGLVGVEQNCYVKSNLNSSGVVVDIGTGLNADFSMSLIRKYGLKSYGFEPNRAYHRNLDALVEKTNGRFSYLPFALSNQTGTSDFYESPTCGSLLRESRDKTGDSVNEYPVRTLTLQEIPDLVGVDHIDVLRMNIEGEESEALENMNQNVFRMVDQLIIKFHHQGSSRFTGYDTERIVNRIMKAGFKVYTRDCSTYLFFH